VRPRATIFDSTSERELFSAINASWEPDFKVYPHVSFANLIDLDPQVLDAAELSYLHRTTVDFVLTSAGGQPLLGIEFDGLGHGYSRGSRYIQVVRSKRDLNRAWKLDLKLRIANAASFPFAVLSHDEKAV
jgi:hypothetical protein